MLHSISHISSLAAYTRKHIALSTVELYNGWVRENDIRVHDSDTVSYYVDLINMIQRTARN